MTTFTLQDLNTATPEEDEAFEALTQALENRKIFDNIQPATKEDFMNQALKQHEQNHAIIQGATGAQYVAMDTTPKPEQYAPQPQHTPTVQELAQQLTQTFNQLITAIANLQPQSQPVSEGLAEAVETVLEQADWFANKVDEKLDELVDDHDFTYEVEQAVENEVGDYFGHNFSLEDHVDVYDLMRDAVEDKLEDLVQEKLTEIIQDKLSTATITFN